MHAKATIFVFFALAVVCNCQIEATGKRCCFAPQFEAVYGGNVGYYVDGTPGSLAQGYEMAFDVIGQRIGTEGSYYYSSGYTLNIKTIQLYKEGKQYTIVNNVCTTSPVSPASTPKKCIPASATFLSHMSQGVDEMELNSWQSDLSQEGMMGSYYFTVSSKTCAPIGASFSGVQESQGKQISLLSSGGFFNITKGISDPDRWFTVPSSCTPADPQLKFSGEKFDIQKSIIEFLTKQSRIIL